MPACYVLGERNLSKEDINETDYVCDGGCWFAVRGRFRDFASRADRPARGRHDRPRRRDASLLARPLLGPTVLGPAVLGPPVLGPTVLGPPVLGPPLLARTVRRLALPMVMLVATREQRGVRRARNAT